MRRIFLIIAFAVMLQVFGLADKTEGQITQGKVKGASTFRGNIGREVMSREGRLSVKTEVYFGGADQKTRKGMLEEIGVVVFPEDRIDFFPEPNLGLGSRITIYRANEIQLLDAGRTKIYRTWAHTVREFFIEKDIELFPNDQLDKGVNALIVSGMKVGIFRADVTKEIQRISIPFKVIVKEDPVLIAGKVRIVNQGENGEKRIIWHVIKHADGRIEREKVGTEITKPVNRVVRKGTKPVSFKGPYYDWILKAAERYGSDPDVMYRIMMCESGGDPHALSPSGKYKGLYQYDNPTWAASGFGDRSIFDPWSQINAAAKAWDSRYTKWPVTSRVCGDLGRR